MTQALMPSGCPATTAYRENLSPQGSRGSAMLRGAGLGAPGLATSPTAGENRLTRWSHCWARARSSEDAQSLSRGARGRVERWSLEEEGGDQTAGLGPLRSSSPRPGVSAQPCHAQPCGGKAPKGPLHRACDFAALRIPSVHRGEELGGAV